MDSSSRDPNKPDWNHIVNQAVERAGGLFDPEAIKRKLLIGAVIMVLIMTSVSGLIWYFGARASDFLMTIPGLERLNVKTDPPPGIVESYDAFTVLPQIKNYAGADAKLNGIELAYVRSDGTMDLTATYKPSATYRFSKQLTTSPEDAPPLGAGGGQNRHVPITVVVSQPGERRTITEIGGDVSTRTHYTNQGMKRDEGEAQSGTVRPIPDPQCSLQDLWRTAIQRGAPANAVATIVYDGTNYTFEIDDTDIDLSFNRSCEVVSS